MINKNKTAAVIVALTMVITATGIDLHAAADSTQAASETVEEDSASDNSAATAGSYSTRSGISLTVSNMIAIAKNADILQSDIDDANRLAPADYTDVAIAQVDNYVNLRAEPNEDSEVLGKLYNNSAAFVTAEAGDWYQIKSGSVTGYVKAEYVVRNDPTLAASVSRRMATVNTQTLFVRTEPTTSSSVLGMVPMGDDLTIVDESMLSSGWVKVSIDEGDGYVSTDYISLSTEYTYAESKAEEEARLAKEEAERKAAQAAAAAARKKSSGSSSKSSSSSSSKTYSAASGSNGQAVVNYAAQFVGNPYVYGGTSLTNGTDCSGFVMSVYSAFGVSLPHSSSADRSVGYGVSTNEMQPGDIVCYSGHVGIYAGNGQIVHAANSRTGITYSNVDYKTILAVRRIF